MPRLTLQLASRPGGVTAGTVAPLTIDADTGAATRHAGTGRRLSPGLASALAQAVPSNKPTAVGASGARPVGLADVSASEVPAKLDLLVATLQQVWLW